jgi:hypothetical protein
MNEKTLLPCLQGAVTGGFQTLFNTELTSEYLSGQERLTFDLAVFYAVILRAFSNS